MSKKDKDNSEVQATEIVDRTISRSISQEMKDSYLDYAMSVIVARALPDVRDGLKPVHRRILYTMHELNLTAGAKTRKSAKITGDVTGNYHPHGDTSVYDAMVKLGQDFSMRYPLVIGQGNFGSIDGDPPAASRYTEAKMAKVTAEILNDIEKDTVDWRPNYEGTRQEPIVLPSSVPNLLLNGAIGIAVGMATNIPPHNLGELMSAIEHLIDNPKATTDDLLQFVKGPDFPTGAVAFNQADIKKAYTTGRGGVVVRGEAEIVEEKRGNQQIIITSIPYRVNKSDLIIKIAKLVRDKKIDGIKGIRDESTTDIRVVIDLKAGSHPQNVLNYIYKHTSLEDTFHFNMVALVDGIPQTLSLKSILEEFIEHRRVVVTRRAEYELRKAQDREHILLGLKKALDHIDKIIKLIRASKDQATAKANLMKEFKFSERQTDAILAMRLAQLAGLERKKIEDELEQVQKLIASLKALLASAVKIKNLIKKELAAITEKYNDQRRTRIVPGGVKNMAPEDLIPNVDNMLVLTAGGYLKRISPDEYKQQHRGGVGVVDMNTKEEDVVETFVRASLHNDILFFTDRGRVFQTKMYDLPEGRRATKGKSVMNFLSLEADESVTAVLPMPKDVKKSESSVVMVTKEGVVKKVDAASFHDVRRSGIIAISLTKGDKLIAVQFASKGDTVLLVSKSGQAIRFKEADVRAMGRTAGGVRGMKLSKGDVIVGAGIASIDSIELLVGTSNGYGKRTSLKEYKIQGRGGSGIKTVSITDKTGELVGAKVVEKDDEEIVVISKKGQVIRLALSEVSNLGRATQGVRIMKPRSGDAVVSVIKL